MGAAFFLLAGKWFGAIMQFHTITIDPKRLLDKETACRLLGVPYKYGTKADMHANPSDLLRGIDCSGFVQWIVYQASNGKVLMPSGSVRQREWCKKMGFKRYGKLGYLANCLLHDHRLRIAFFAGNPGHVWGVLDGKTIESHGGTGPDRRSPLSRPLLKVQECFVLTEPLD